MKSYDALPANLLPFAKSTHRKPQQERVDATTPAQRLEWHARATRRKAWLYACSAWHECSKELLVLAEDAPKADRLARDAGWSRLKDMGWTCASCAPIYKAPRAYIGPRPNRRTWRTALTETQRNKIKARLKPLNQRMTTQEFWNGVYTPTGQRVAIRRDDD